MSRLARDPRVLWRRSADRVVLLAPDAADPMVLDGVGAVVWELLDTPAELDELIGLLSSHYRVERTEVADQLAPFLTALRADGALEDGS